MVVLYVDQRLDRMLFGWEMPAAGANSIDPIFVILLARVFAAPWTRLGVLLALAGPFLRKLMSVVR